MDQEFKFGLTAPNMRENGALIRLTVAESSGTQTETSMRASGKMTRPTATESMFM